MFPLEIVSGEVDEKETQQEVENFYGINSCIHPHNRCLKASTRLTVSRARTFAGGIGNRSCFDSGPRFQADGPGDAGFRPRTMETDEEGVMEKIII
jgi:hypothetical protein